MDEDFELPVTYKGKEICFLARLLQYGYSYKIEVDLEENKLHLEKDDSGAWRAIMPESDNSNKSINLDLIQAIISSIDQ